MLPVNGLYGHIQKNALKSALLLASFALLVALFFLCWCVIYVAVADYIAMRFHLGHPQARLTVSGLLVEGEHRALALWWIPPLATALWFAIAWTFHGDMISAATGANDVTRSQEPQLYNIVENLAITAGLPVPRIQIMETKALNAYASGLSPKTAVVAVTRGLLRALTKDELEAVLAHEITHIVNRDVRLMVIATVFVGVLTLIGNHLTGLFSGWNGPVIYDSDYRRSRDEERESDSSLIAVLITVAIAVLFLALTHVMALLVNFAISRSREFMADAGSAQLTKNPDALISALNKISGRYEIPNVADQMMAMMISADASSLFATHPDISARIEALEKYAGGRSSARYENVAATAPSFDGGAPAGSLGFADGARVTFGKRRPSF
jgi:heat shock protein HtpX